MEHINNRLPVRIASLLLLALAGRCWADPVRLPDGILGRPNATLLGSYASVSTASGISVVDRKTAGIGLALPLFPELTLAGFYTVSKEDSVMHSLGLEATLYSVTPVQHKETINPDGRLGAPVLSLGYSVTFRDGHSDRASYMVTGKSLLPISGHLTLGAGGSIYQRDNPRHVQQGFAEVRIYPRAYPPGEEYSNPDGPEGTLVLHLLGGGSRHGLFGQIDFIVPLESSTTVSVMLRGERASYPRVSTVILGLQARFYPGSL